MTEQRLTVSLYAPGGQRKYLNAEERRRFLAASHRAPPQVRTLCLTLLYLGCRISEALALTGGDVAVDAGLVAIRCLKKRGAFVVREVPAHPVLIAALEQDHRLRQRSARLWPW